MKTRKITIKEILAYLGQKVIGTEGPVNNVYIDNLAEVERVNSTTLDWVNPAKQNKQLIVEQSKAKVLMSLSYILKYCQNNARL